MAKIDQNRFDMPLMVLTQHNDKKEPIYLPQLIIFFFEYKEESLILTWDCSGA